MEIEVVLGESHFLESLEGAWDVSRASVSDVPVFMRDDSQQEYGLCPVLSFDPIAIRHF